MENSEQKIEEKTIEERKEKIKNWLKNPYNLAFIGILILAFSIRLYYFNLTKDQPLWWDEAEYMLKAKNIAFGTPDTGWGANVRPILFPFIASIFFKIGLGLVAIKFVWVILSVGGILLLYFIAKDLFNERVGLITAFLSTVFYIDLFYTSRLMVDMPAVFLILLASFFFVKYKFGNGSKKYVWLILPVLFVGVMLRFTVGLFIISILIFLLLTERFSLFKKKEWYVSTFFGMLAFSPFMIYSWIKFRNPFYSITYVLTEKLVGNDTQAGYAISNILKYFINYIHIFFFVLFLIGFIMIILSLVLRYDRMLSERTSQIHIFLFLWAIIPVIYFGFIFNYFEDRYLFMIFPVVFMTVGLAIDRLSEYIPIKSKKLMTIIIIALLFYGGFSMIKQADLIIKNKVSSYKDFKDAGLWIKENSYPGDIIINAGKPQNTYYSERATKSPNDFTSKEELNKFIEENKPKYLVLSIWERNPNWLQPWVQNNSEKLKPIKVYSLNGDPQQVSAVIYEIQY